MVPLHTLRPRTQVLLVSLFPSLLRRMTHLPFHYYNKTPEVIYKEVCSGSVSNISVHSVLAPLLLGLQHSSMSEQGVRGAAELLTSKKDIGTGRKRSWGPTIFFEYTLPVI